MELVPGVVELPNWDSCPRGREAAPSIPSAIHVARTRHENELSYPYR